MTADACDNVYICEMEVFIWRITHEKKKEMVASMIQACSTLNFDSGVSVWKRDYLYVGGPNPGLI